MLSFAGTDVSGRTGVHAHLAHAHIVIPTSGRAVSGRRKEIRLHHIFE